MRNECSNDNMNFRIVLESDDFPTILGLGVVSHRNAAWGYGSIELMMTLKLSRALLVLFGLLALVACSPRVVEIFVTPTPVGDIGAGSPAGIEPIETATEEVIALVPTETLPARPPNALPTVRGSIVSVNTSPAAPPPTGTPEPTNTVVSTPTAQASPTTPATAVPTATVQPYTPTATNTAGPSPTPYPVLDAPRMGIQVDSYLDRDDWNEALYRVEQLGVGWIKFQVDWSLFQPNNAGEISDEFRRFEIYVEEASNRGLFVLLSVAKAPDWARSNTQDDGPPDDPAALGNFITLILQEIGQAVNAVEVWNEPNLIREWTGQPMTGQRYLDYFVAGYQAVRAYSPITSVVTAGLAPTTDIAGASRDDRAFLREMYAAGLASYVGDVHVGVHPYGWGNPPDARCCDLTDARGWDEDAHFFFLDTLDEYRAIMVENGHQAALMWVTEFGWATWDRLPGDPPDPWMSYNTEALQVQYTLRAFEIGQSRGDMGLMVLWNLNFSSAPLVENRDERAGYGLILPDGYNPVERPLFWALFEILNADS